MCFSMQIDVRETHLLRLLQQDNRLAVAALGEEGGMPTSACWRRIRRYEEAGIITGYGARVHPAKPGLGFQAIVRVHLTRHDPAQLVAFIDVVEARDEVMVCFAMTGQADCQLRGL